MKHVLHVVMSGLAISCSGLAFAGAGEIDTLTIEQAVLLAVENHPSLRAAEANYRGAAAGHKQAMASYLPALSFGASATHTEGVFVFNPTIPSRSQIYNSYTGGFQAQQLLFDFGKTIGRVSASTDLVDAANADMISAKEIVKLNVQIAYFALLAYQRVTIVNRDAVVQAESHLTQAKAFYSVGRRSQFDVTRAEVDLANANVNLIRATNQMQVSKVQLENAMGVHPPRPYAVVVPHQMEPIATTMDSARAIALIHRPELQAAAARVEANKALARAAWSQHLPILSATGNWTWNGFEPSPLFPRWNVGVQLSLPIFQGFSLEAQVEQTEAAADAAQANLDVQTQTVLLEVEQAFLAFKEAQERRVATAKLVEQAEQNLNLANKQYAAGVGTAIEVTDAQVSQANAQITHIQALYDHITSLVKLRRAMGIPID
jgi:outer membrane protein